MSLWKRVNTCSPEAVEPIKQYYNEKGLAEVRAYFAQWIEERILSEGPSIPEFYEQRAQKFQEDLKKQLITLCNENLIKQFKLSDIAHITQAPAVELYNSVRNGLQKEFQMLEQMTQNTAYMCPIGGMVNSPGFGGPTGSTDITMGSYMVPVANAAAVNTNLGNGGGAMSGLPNMVTSGGVPYTREGSFVGNERVQWLLREVDSRSVEASCFKNELELFQQLYSSYTQSKACMPAMHSTQTDQMVQDKLSALRLHCTSIIENLRRTTDEYGKLQDLVINELKNWQHHQALAGNGAHFPDNLEFIQSCVEMSMDFLDKLISIVNSMISTKFDGVNDLSEQLHKLRHAQEMLIASAFIVEKQPPQVMKTNTKFAAGVRWLIGNRLGIAANRPQVECVILSEAQAQRYSQQCSMNNAALPPPSSGEITSNVVTMDYTDTNGVFFASFRSMSLKKIRRAEKKGTESVMDEKFTLFFSTSCIVNDYRICVWTISLPVVVIVHGNQEPQSWATITWDNAFSEIGREPFQVPEKVTWSLLASTLNTKFASVTGRGLTEENLSFLHDKLFTNDPMNTSQGDHKEYITWGQFCKENLRNRSFTFWDWFYAIMKLTKDHFLGLWKAGLVYGFIDKNRTMDILSSQPSGTFLLRFSDSTMGGISVAFIDDNRSVLMLEPWTAKDLNILNLPDRVHDIDRLRYVYSLNMARDEAFKDFYSPRNDEQTNRDGYVPNKIKVDVPAIEGGSLQATPQHQMQSPPHPQEMQVGENFALNIHDLEDMLYSYGSDKH